MTSALQVNEIEAARERLLDVKNQVSRVYIGDDVSVGTMLVALLARGHVLLEGVPGVAKTTLVKAVATALGVSELLAGLLPCATSLVAAVGQVVIDLQPRATTRTPTSSRARGTTTPK